MAQRIPRPDKGTPLLEEDGRTVNQQWFDWFGYIDRQVAGGLAGQVDVKLTSIVNGQVLIWNATDGKFENGAN